MRDTGLLYVIIQIIVLIASYVFGRYIVPTLGASESIQDITAKFNLIVNYADQFVSWAKWFMRDSTGTQKMNKVVEQLMLIVDKYNLDISEEEVIAIAQKAYDNMKAALEEAENAKKIANAAEAKANNIAIVSTTAAASTHKDIDPGIYKELSPELYEDLAPSTAIDNYDISVISTTIDKK